MNTRKEIGLTRAVACVLLLAFAITAVYASQQRKIKGIVTALEPLPGVPSDDELSMHVSYSDTGEDIYDAILDADKKYDIDRGFIDFCAESDVLYPTGDFMDACRRYLNSNGYRDEMWETLTGRTFSVLYDIYTGRLESENVTVLGSVYDLSKTSLAFAGVIDIAHGYVVSSELSSMTRDADIMLAFGGTRIPSADMISLYAEFGVDIVSFTDTSADSLTDMHRYLDDAGIYSLGVDSEIRYYISGGMKLALCAASLTDEDITGSFCSTVAEAKSNADIVIACVRFDSDEPTDAEITAAHDVIDAGADLIVGSCPNALLPVEYYNGTPIVYSLGGLRSDRDAHDSALLTVSVSVGIRPVLRFYPCTASGGELSLADEENSARIIGMMNSRSQTANIGNDNRIRER